MAEQNDPVMDEVMTLLENEPINAPFIAPTTNILALREELAVLVSTGRCKEAIGVRKKSSNTTKGTRPTLVPKPLNR